MTEQHKHDHEHKHTRAGAGSVNRGRLRIVLALTIIYMLAEAIGGFLSNSLALLSDAGHMLTDVAAISLAMLALWFASRPATHQKTYGYYRMEILAALANGVALVVISLLIFLEAVQRIRAPEPVRGLEVTIIGAGGLVVNGISASLLHRASEENLNMRAAFLHVVSDAIGSLGAIIAGLLIWRKGVLIADPLISIAIAFLIVYSSWQLIRDAVNVLLEGTPAHIDIAAVIASMRRVGGIREVHDLHVWTISSGKDALSAHVTITEGASHKAVLEDLHDCLRTEFNIGHLTIQVESGDEAQDDTLRLYQISRRSEIEPDAPGSGNSGQSAAAGNGES
jgi:cobalt-zinc-cadmium efflux system protein